jgi:hypothetical protein|mmetsp:Transcript_87664/g.137410  ORF Transcript_87664/g.137410 Transcript_87664/m.137410 type:complete len:660 (+) Transcript_87664:41-2020(+)
MKTMQLILSATVAALLTCTAHAGQVTPIQKVLQMMEDLLSKGKAMKHEEEVEFAKYHEWCENTLAEATKSIKEGAAEIEKLTADIAKAESDAEVLGEEVAALQQEVAAHEADAKSATAVRNKEHEAYVAQHLDLSESVDAIAKAISILKSRSADIAQSLLQVSSLKLVPPQSKAVLTSFLSMHAGEVQGAPEANAYEFQSGGVVDMLEKLKLKFEDQRFLLEKEEMNAKANYEVLMQQLTDDIKADSSAVASKTAAKGSRLEAAGQAKGDKAVAEQTKVTDEKTLSDTTAECAQSSKEYEANQVTRADELKAISKAIEILSSDEVKGTGEKYLPSALQISKSFAQLRSSVEPSSVRSKAVEYLQAKATKLGSRYLSVVATHAQEDPFGKVKKMIKDLITKLMEEANSEADHNGYCTSELATNKQTREIKSTEVDELSAQVESETAKNEQLTTEITDLADAISELKGKQAEATKLRGTEKENNAQVVSEAKDAQHAVEEAIKVLKDFYDSSGSTAFLQTKEPYKGMLSESGGIIGMLEVVLSDFARLETETSEAEELGQHTYDTFMDESNQDVAVKETEQKHKEKNRDRCQEKLRGLKKELEMTQEELDTALDYYDKLKKQCLDTGLSYAERKKMREEEIVSLQEALKILSGEDIEDPKP